MKDWVIDDSRQFLVVSASSDRIEIEGYAVLSKAQAADLWVWLDKAIGEGDTGAGA